MSSFRITNGMMINTFVRNMNNNMAKMDKYTSQLSSNRRMVRLSDDPVGVYTSLTARQRLQRYEQYQDSLVTARNWVESADTALQEISSRLTYVKEQLIYAADNATKTANDRANIGVLVQELRSSMIETLNNVVGDQHIFAGYSTFSKPFTLADDGTTVLYNGIDLSQSGDPIVDAKIAEEQHQAFTIEVGFNLEMEISVNGIDVAGLGDSNLFKITQDIIDLMNSDTEDSAVIEQMSEQIDMLSKAHENMLAQLVKVGAMTNKIDILEDRYSQDVINYNTVRSRIEDLDSAETIMEWKMAEAVYKQSLSTGARVIQPTLMDFLK